MVGTNAKMIAIRMVRSKLRKRDEHTVRQDHVILHSAQQNNNHCHHNSNASGAATPPLPPVANGGNTISTVSATVICPPVPSPAEATAVANGHSTQRQFIWQLPAPYVLHNTSTDKETLVHPLSPEQTGICRGFRKNLQGRWKRLVKRKPSNETYAIPPELRDQLKNIYVY